MDYSHIFGCASEPWNCVSTRRDVTSSPAVVTKIRLKAGLSEVISLMWNCSIPGEYASQILREIRKSIGSHRLVRGHFLPRWAAKSLSAAPGNTHTDPRIQPIFAARKPRLDIEEFLR
jgi:hypothetical protein